MLARLILRAEAISSSRIEGLVIGPRRLLKAELNPKGSDVTATEAVNNIRAMDEAIALASIAYDTEIAKPSRPVPFPADRR